MLFAVVYAWLRLLLDLVDVRLRVNDPEAELLLLRHQLRVVGRQVKRPQLNAADRRLASSDRSLQPLPGLIHSRILPTIGARLIIARSLVGTTTPTRFRPAAKARGNKS